MSDKDQAAEPTKPRDLSEYRHWLVARMQFAALVIFAIAIPTGLAVEPAIDDKNTGAAANFFANCAGVWDFNANLMTADNKPAVAERLHNMGNGAQAAALWLLASQHAIDTGQTTSYGSWLGMVAPKREDGKLRMQGLAELRDFEQIQTESNVCLEAAGEQEKILETMRKDRVRSAQDALPQQ